MVDEQWIDYEISDYRIILIEHVLRRSTYTPWSYLINVDIPHGWGIFISSVAPTSRSVSTAYLWISSTSTALCSETNVGIRIRTPCVFIAYNSDSSSWILRVDVNTLLCAGCLQRCWGPVNQSFPVFLHVQRCFCIFSRFDQVVQWVGWNTKMPDNK